MYLDASRRLNCAMLRKDQSYFVICFTCVDFLRIYNTCCGIISLNDFGAGEVRGHVDKLTVGWNADSGLPKFVYILSNLIFTCGCHMISL
jgi:hypothetical protein